MFQQKINPRTEYREQESERINDSETLAQKFPNLNALTASLAHFAPQGDVQTRSIKYTFNLDHAKSFFRFDCSNEECVGGDYDLSAQLAEAVAAHRATLAGEVTCQGWRNKNTIGSVRCQNILRYKLSLGYKDPKGAKAVPH